MEVKLNVYEGGKVIRTYSARNVDLPTGLCEDVLKEVDIDKMLDGRLDDEKLGVEIIKIAVKSMPKFRPFILGVFPDMSPEEYAKTSIKEVGAVIVKIVRYTVGELYSIGAEKN